MGPLVSNLSIQFLDYKLSYTEKQNTISALSSFIEIKVIQFSLFVCLFKSCIVYHLLFNQLFCNYVFEFRVQFIIQYCINLIVIMFIKFVYSHHLLIML